MPKKTQTKKGQSEARVKTEVHIKHTMSSQEKLKITTVVFWQFYTSKKRNFWLLLQQFQKNYINILEKKYTSLWSIYCVDITHRVISESTLFSKNHTNKKCVWCAISVCTFGLQSPTCIDPTNIVKNVIDPRLKKA